MRKLCRSRNRGTPDPMTVDAAMTACACLVLWVIAIDLIAYDDCSIVQPWLITLDTEDVVSLLGFDDEASSLSLGMQCISGDDRADDLERFEQWSKGENLVRLIVFYIALTNNHSSIMTKR
ncbi:hypothetical protein FEAC_20230 [Ferrimicrobium acidiphilum DSM 19497]|uniref:Uncharacterized protein n=1 Tax=Ferrimicrobium acidiphilum DSM 19497 TaxID=1121877 RepID=A0A0D8FSP2_9ACTN|nr:hypothetical protein FEAC_20230 [Ferrimicrobium acidiphilum DSM 19497]